MMQAHVCTASVQAEPNPHRAHHELQQLLHIKLLDAIVVVQCLPSRPALPVV
jgi:hypothetical protein